MNILNSKLWFSRKELLKWNKKHFTLVLQKLSFRLKKQTSKNVVDTTFKWGKNNFILHFIFSVVSSGTYISNKINNRRQFIQLESFLQNEIVIFIHLFFLHHGIPCHWSLSIHSENRKSVWLKWVDRYLLYQAFWNSLGYSTEGYSKLFPSETLFWINILAQSQQWKHQNNNWNLLQVNNTDT